MFKSKIDRVLDANREKLKRHDDEKLALEKGDLTAMIIAGYVTLFPVLIILIGMCFLVVKMII